MWFVLIVSSKSNNALKSSWSVAYIPHNGCDGLALNNLQAFGLLDLPLFVGLVVLRRFANGAEILRGITDLLRRRLIFFCLLEDRLERFMYGIVYVLEYTHRKKRLNVPSYV